MKELLAVLYGVPVVLIVLASLMWFAGVQTEWQERTGATYVYPYRGPAIALTFVAGLVAVVAIWLRYDWIRRSRVGWWPPMPPRAPLP